MPVFNSFKQSREARKRYENLMALAKQNPGSVLDLSECELKSIPAAIFSKCQSLHMESLVLHTNLLKTFNPESEGSKITTLANIKLLDLHNNRITQLPRNMGSLLTLQVLDMENNCLTEIPQSIGNLKKLQKLLLKDNFLTCLPSSVQMLSCLQTLDISGTNKVYYLPKMLCCIKTLELLILSNPALMEYPPPMVAAEGLEAIKKFMCRDVGVEYVAPSQALTSTSAERNGEPVSHKLHSDASTERKSQQVALKQQLSENSIEHKGQAKEHKFKISVFKSKKQSKEARKRYENLLVLAKDNKDSTFDLSECELRSIPSTVLLQCRLLQKENLILHTNLLKEFLPESEGGKLADLLSLKVLDLHGNRITQLPANLGTLMNLQILNVENNKLEELPKSLWDLQHLETLLVKDNHLTSLPTSVHKLQHLRAIDISGTNEVYFLPKTLCRVRTLEILNLPNPSRMEYPPYMIAKEGLQAIQKFMCKDVGIEYISPSHAVEKPLSEEDIGLVSPGINPILNDGMIQQYQWKQEEKTKHQIALEKQLAKEQYMRTVLTSKAKDSKHKSQAHIREEIERLDKTMMEQRVKRDKEKAVALEMTKQVEIESKIIVSKLVTDKSRSEKQQQLFKGIRELREQQYEMFLIPKVELNDLKKIETLADMETNLLESRQNQELSEFLQNLSTKKLQDMLGKEDIQLQELENSDQLQKEAFVMLIIKCDAALSCLLSKMFEYGQHLSNLSILEFKRQKLKMNQDQRLIKSLRTEITDLLVQLVKERSNHEKVIKQKLIDMEQHEDKVKNFWLIQYRKLLDSNQPSLINQINLHPEDKMPQPEPTTSTATPSAPLDSNAVEMVLENECLVCKNKQSDCVLLSCGHVCACCACAEGLLQCPMCRSCVTQRIKIPTK